MKKLRTVLTGCILTAALLVTGGCNQQPASYPGYKEILENGLGMSSQAVIETYSLDLSDAVQTGDEASARWELPEEDGLAAGYPAVLQLGFKDDALVEATYTVTLDDYQQKDAWQALHDIYADMEKNLGEPVEMVDGKQPFGRFTDQQSFLDTAEASLQSDGMYMESNNWLPDSPEGTDHRADLMVTIFTGSDTVNSGNISIAIMIYDTAGLH